VSRDRFSLRTRLVAAFVLVALVVLTLSGIATIALVRRSLQENALSNLRARSADLRAVVSGVVGDDPGSVAVITERLARFRAQLRTGLRFTDMRAVDVGPDGTVGRAGTADFFELPDMLTPSDLDTATLVAGREVSGRKGDTVFLAQPVARVGDRTIVLVATDTVDTEALRGAAPWLFLAALLVLLVVFGISLWLARRLTRPINEIERAARQLASGDLSARARVAPATDEELVALAGTLNAMASRLETARGGERAFLLSVSHDLRTPLTSIRGYAEALADGTLDEHDVDARRRAATVIASEARRLERLVRDLLDLSRLDTRQFSLSQRACDAAEIVRDAAEAFVPQARELGIALAVHAGDPIPAAVDPDRLAQIVANLVENALKYASSRVEVTTARTDGDTFAIVVTDDGPGIPTDELARVFDRLYTVRAVPGRSVGTGLGLAIVRELAAAMGGRSWAEPSPSGGSSFLVSFPVGVEHADTTARPAAGMP
jgi:two-component system sensor histidine kinase BaeS